VLLWDAKCFRFHFFIARQNCVRDDGISANTIGPCVCVAAKHTVLQANAKVNGRGQILHFHHSQTLQPIWIIISNISLCRPTILMRKFGLNRFSHYGSVHEWKTCFSVDSLLTYPSIIIYPVSCRSYKSQFCVNCNAEWLKHGFMQPLVSTIKFLTTSNITDKYITAAHTQNNKHNNSSSKVKVLFTVTTHHQQLAATTTRVSSPHVTLTSCRLKGQAQQQQRMSTISMTYFAQLLLFWGVSGGLTSGLAANS